MRQIVTQVRNLEKEMKSSGAWVFGGRLYEPDTATAVPVLNGEVLTSDGPFAESKEHLGGFYSIQAEDLDSAVSWASKVTQVVGSPIEVLLALKAGDRLVPTPLLIRLTPWTFLAVASHRPRSRQSRLSGWLPMS